MIHHGDTEARSKLLHEQPSEQIIGAAIEVYPPCFRGETTCLN
jgi:hypothetical protein